MRKALITEQRQGLVLYHLLGLAINDPGAVVGERQKHHGSGMERVKAWQHRAVVQVLKEQGVDPYSAITTRGWETTDDMPEPADA